jgi:hypothetical protein
MRFYCRIGQILCKYFKYFSLICECFVQFDFEEKKLTFYLTRQSFNAVRQFREIRLERNENFCVNENNQRLETDENKLITTKLLAHNTRLCSPAG